MKQIAQALCFLLAPGLTIFAAAAQGTGEEIRPALELYVQQGSLVRVEFQDSF